MQELSLIESAAAHTCASPHTERWHVIEPVSGRWTWLTVYTCCDQVYEEQAPAAMKADTAAQGGAEGSIRRAA